MYTVGRLAKKYGLSRSTLLYYDKIGVLTPSGHMKGEYRRYSSEDERRLEKICQYRRAGISLKEIRLMLDGTTETVISEALEKRLVELNDEMSVLKSQQDLIAHLLGKTELLANHSGLNKETWVDLLSAAGFSEEDMRQWHVNFERTAPAKHEEFLRQLSIPDSEIMAIRSLAAAPHKILSINKESGKFMELFFKIYEGLKREGPGNIEMTGKALSMCSDIPDNPKILDLGCGSGAASVDLATLTGGRVTAVDVYQPFLDRVLERANDAGVGDNVTVRKSDMASLDFEPESFDVIWCEGAAYIMGVDKALKYWKQFLKPGGYLVFSDAVWLTSDPSEEVAAYWKEGYPDMRRAEDNAAASVQAGYDDLGHFVIDTACWYEFYDDLEERNKENEKLYGSDPDGRAILDMNNVEISMFRHYPEEYGYAFQVVKK